MAQIDVALVSVQWDWMSVFSPRKVDGIWLCTVSDICLCKV